VKVNATKANVGELNWYHMLGMHHFFILG
jgi:hypothetical protein